MGGGCSDILIISLRTPLPTRVMEYNRHWRYAERNKRKSTYYQAVYRWQYRLHASWQHGSDIRTTVAATEGCSLGLERLGLDAASRRFLERLVSSRS